jgi:copper homeostasis protein
MPLIKEACVENETQIDTAVKTKANRIELCSRLDFGGLTPSIDLINYVIAKKIPVVVMIRVNDKYNATWWEYRKMLTQIRKLRNLQIEGFIFGLLDKKGFIDYKRNKKLVKTCRDKQKIFHMAFDEFAN